MPGERSLRGRDPSANEVAGRDYTRRIVDDARLAD